MALRVRAFRHLLSLMTLRCIIFSITLQSWDIVHSQSLLNSPGGASPGPSPGFSVLQRGNFKNAGAVTHSHCCPFISAPPMTVSPCLAGKWDCVGLNVSRAQRPLVKSGRFGPRWLASTEFLQVVSNSIFPEPCQPRLDL